MQILGNLWFNQNQISDNRHLIIISEHGFKWVVGVYTFYMHCVQCLVLGHH